VRLFISAGEPSGDLHGANLIRALRRLRPDIECVGFGGDRMKAAGCRLLFPLCNLAVMWFARVLARAPVFLRLLSQADRYFRHRRPDAVVLIDYPGFHWWLARRASFHGVRVFYFVPPQLWAWGGWRVTKMQRWVDHVLCTLPFEESWYRERGVAAAHYVGHPYFDELSQQRLDRTFVAAQTARPGRIIGLLPGSRTQEVERNLPTLLRVAARVHEVCPDTRFLVACFRPAHERYVKSYLRRRPLPSVETHVGRTAEVIHLARACVAVSGSVTLELLYAGKPSVIIYRVGRLDLRVCRFFMTSSYISLVNLMAGRELFPEFLTDRCPAGAVAERLLGWIEDHVQYEKVCGELADLRERVALPGACRRAAEYVVARSEERSCRGAAAFQG
jgi:lipid-A-disaccharide synthase